MLIVSNKSWRKIRTSTVTTCNFYIAPFTYAVLLQPLLVGIETFAKYKADTTKNNINLQKYSAQKTW